ncbi:MAG: YciK family oxidoreductase, partial [Idiomarina sp.]|nr:YciK family oxidoreductase [Idiomarina sp.]
MQSHQTFTAPENALRDKVILVTGAGDGIGKEAAITFARHGATVILLGRTVAKLEAV